MTGSKIVQYHYDVIGFIRQKSGAGILCLEETEKELEPNSATDDLIGKMLNLLEKESFGECLVRLRQNHNLSQKALSILAEMDQSYLAGLESGRRAPPKEKQIGRLIQALRASAQEEQELRAAHSYSKFIGSVDEENLAREIALASLHQQLKKLSLDGINEISHLAFSLNRQTQIRENI